MNWRREAGAVWSSPYSRGQDNVDKRQGQKVPARGSSLEEIKAEIVMEMARLSESYVPQWRLDTKAPDIGAVIALIFAGQLAEAEAGRCQLKEKCKAYLADVLGVRPAPCVPARTVLVLDVDEEGAKGVPVEKGSKFYKAGTDEGQRIPFETVQDILASPVRLSKVFGVSQEHKKIVAYDLDAGKKARPLFSFAGENLYRERVRVTHPLLDTGHVDIKRPPGSHRLAAQNIRLQAGGWGIAPRFLYDGSRELKGEACPLFGREILPYQECWIEGDDVFAREGAEIACTFELGWGSCDTRKKQAKKQELKPIMRRRPEGTEPEPPHIYPLEISITYFNGEGFCTLDITEGDGIFTQVFEGKKQGKIIFCCPEGWERAVVGGRKARCMRLQILQVKNGYAPGAIHHYPVVENIRFAWSYGEKGVRPKAVTRFWGNRKAELKEGIERGEMPELFGPFPYTGEWIVLGFDKVPPPGPVGLYMELTPAGGGRGLKPVFEYSAEDGFKPLHVIDGTDGFTGSGILRFLVPSDAAMATFEGEKLFWIRIQDLEKDREKKHFPKLIGCLWNAVDAVNMEVSDWKEYSLEQVEARIEVSLPETCIIDAQVWVNEKSSLTEEEQKQMAAEQPGRIQAVYDIQGRLSEFFVKWEQEGKDEGDGRYFRLDRQKRILRLGDGQIPPETEGTAWKIRVAACDGDRGNIPAWASLDPARSYLFLNRAYTPTGAYGGSKGESCEEMLRRNKGFLGIGTKAVSGPDIVARAKAFSSQIVEASLWMGEQGPDSLLVLVQPFGAGVFEQLREPLKVHLEQYAPVLLKGGLIIREPVFIQVSVHAWILADTHGVLEAEDMVAERLRSYLEEELGGRRRFGIGRLPDVWEVERALAGAAKGMCLGRMQIVVSYTDETGYHEKDLGDLPSMPQGVCINGNHQIHIETI